MSEECEKLYKKHSSSDCCNVPSPTLNHDQEKHCIENCADKPRDSCCMEDCFYEITGIISFHKVNPDRLFRVFENFYTDTMKLEKQLWIPVMQNTSELCKSIGEICEATRNLFNLSISSSANYVNKCHRQLWNARLHQRTGEMFQSNEFHLLSNIIVCGQHWMRSHSNISQDSEQMWKGIWRNVYCA